MTLSIRYSGFNYDGKHLVLVLGDMGYFDGDHDGVPYLCFVVFGILFSLPLQLGCVEEDRERERGQSMRCTSNVGAAEEAGMMVECFYFKNCLGVKYNNVDSSISCNKCSVRERKDVWSRMGSGLELVCPKTRVSPHTRREAQCFLD